MPDIYIYIRDVAFICMVGCIANSSLFKYYSCIIVLQYIEVTKFYARCTVLLNFKEMSM